MPGALRPEQVEKAIPKDILIFNWLWGDENNDKTVQAFGFNQVYGNFRPNIRGWERRSSLEGVLGGVPSSWAGTTEMNFGKDLLYDFLGCASLLWSQQETDRPTLIKTVHQLVPEIRNRLSREKSPSAEGRPVEPVDINPYCNAGFADTALSGLQDLSTGV